MPNKETTLYSLWYDLTRDFPPAIEVDALPIEPQTACVTAEMIWATGETANIVYLNNYWYKRQDEKRKCTDLNTYPLIVASTEQRYCRIE